MIVIFAENQKQFLEISETKYKGKDFEMLSKKEQDEIAYLFGYSGKKEFEKDSILDDLFSVFNESKNVANKPINDFLLSSESPLYKLNSSYSEKIHESLLQYALDKKNWKIVSNSFKMDGAITGKDSIGKKIKYSLEYKGKGDKTVTKFLDKPVEIKEDFDPVKPWAVKTDVSKNWKKQDYIDYTGLGNGEFKDVNFKYEIEWSNVGIDPDFPFWVITKIDCLRKDDNNQWIKFYPVM